MHLLFTTEDDNVRGGAEDVWMGVLGARATGLELLGILLKLDDGSILTKCFSNNKIQAVITLI